MHRRTLLLIVSLLTLLAAPAAAQEATPQAGALTTVASGLISPRGFLWTADGTLYVAQAGSGGASLGTPTAPPPVGPFQGGSTASVVRIENGCPVLVAGGLPSTSDQIGGILGVEDLAVLGGQLYAAVDGGGEAHGNAAQPSGVYRIMANGSAELVADLSAWVRANPVASIPPDFDPDAAGYGLVADEAAGTFWVENPNSGEILSVSLDGAVTRVADLSAGHLVPTMLAADPQGGVYVGYLTAVPFPDGVAKVSHVAADGTVTDVWTGLTAVTDVAVSPDGTLYAVEMSTGNLEEPPFLVPGSGRIVRQTGPASAEVVASGLMFPITIRFGPDGALYVAIPAMGAASGGGVIARVDGMGTPGAIADMPTCTPVGGAAPAA
jgi:hypothetical protein